MTLKELAQSIECAMLREASEFRVILEVNGKDSFLERVTVDRDTNEVILSNRKENAL